jgi:hypothetical protein
MPRSSLKSRETHQTRRTSRRSSPERRALQIRQAQRELSKNSFIFVFIFFGKFQALRKEIKASSRAGSWGLNLSTATFSFWFRMLRSHIMKQVLLGVPGVFSKIFLTKRN